MKVVKTRHDPTPTPRPAGFTAHTPSALLDHRTNLLYPSTFWILGGFWRSYLGSWESSADLEYSKEDL